MATETLRPNDAGDLTQISNQYPDSGEHWDKVDEETPDTITYVKGESDGTYYDLYNLPAHSVGRGTINFIKVYSRAKADTTPDQYTHRIHIKTGGTIYDGAQVLVTTSWVTYSDQWNTNPKTEVAWTWDDIDALQIGISLRYESSSPLVYPKTSCTQVYVEVDYTPPFIPRIVGIF